MMPSWQSIKINRAPKVLSDPTKNFGEKFIFMNPIFDGLRTA